MVISLDTVATNAEAVGASYARELLRVVVHGVLHLCGINDKGPGEREIMEAHEDAALALYDRMLAEQEREGEKENNDGDDTAGMEDGKEVER